MGIGFFAVYDNHLRLPGMTIHDYLPPPFTPPAVPFVPPAFPSPFGGFWCANIELPHRLRGEVPWTNKLTTTVRGDSHFMAKASHDVGALIRHVPLPPNAGILFTLLFSKYKLMFSSSSVKLEGKSAATWLYGLSVACSQPCASPGLAGPNAVVTYPCTVTIGMTVTDILGGVWGAAVEMGTDLAFNFLRMESASGLSKYVGRATARRFARTVLRQHTVELLREALHAVEHHTEEVGVEFVKDLVKDLLQVPFTHRVPGGRVPVAGVEIVDLVQEHLEQAFEREGSGESEHASEHGSEHPPERDAIVCPDTPYAD